MTISDETIRDWCRDEGQDLPRFQPSLDEADAAFRELLALRAQVRAEQRVAEGRAAHLAQVIKERDQAWGRESALLAALENAERCASVVAGDAEACLGTVRSVIRQALAATRTPDAGRAEPKACVRCSKQNAADCNECDDCKREISEAAGTSPREGAPAEPLQDGTPDGSHRVAQAACSREGTPDAEPGHPNGDGKGSSVAPPAEPDEAERAAREWYVENVCEDDDCLSENVPLLAALLRTREAAAREAGRVEGLKEAATTFANMRRDGVDVHPYVFRTLSELAACRPGRGAEEAKAERRQAVTVPDGWKCAFCLTRPATSYTPRHPDLDRCEVCMGAMTLEQWNARRPGGGVK